MDSKDLLTYQAYMEKSLTAMAAQLSAIEAMQSTTEKTLRQLQAENVELRKTVEHCKSKLIQQADEISILRRATFREMLPTQPAAQIQILGKISVPVCSRCKKNPCAQNLKFDGEFHPTCAGCHAESIKEKNKKVFYANDDDYDYQRDRSYTESESESRSPNPPRQRHPADTVRRRSSSPSTMVSQTPFRGQPPQNVEHFSGGPPQRRTPYQQTYPPQVRRRSPSPSPQRPNTEHFDFVRGPQRRMANNGW